ncbi:exportin-7-B-like [Phyllobates terribilis]|uniref:exportin-7-B-like n=1 Tax=Phyllobates terribilis TaxID=111132 RepID=UPI003CCA75A3
MENMVQLEALCERLYNCRDSAERAFLESTLKNFSVDPTCIAQCQYILGRAGSPYTVLLASSSLMKQVTENKLPSHLRLPIRDCLVNYLASRGRNLESFAMTSLIQLLCRVTKFSWLDDDRFKELVKICASFLDQETFQYEIGLKILNQLTTEMNTQNPELTFMQHRKAAISFKDDYLLQVFEMSLASLCKLKSDARTKLQELALSLSLRCLSFDFTGASSDETSDEIGTVQVPSSWRPVIEELSTVQVYFDYYAMSKPPRSKQALECLVWLASVRRTLFTTDSSRLKYLAALMAGSKQIMETGRGLDDHDNYNEFCRLLGRFKVHYQLSELVNREEYGGWLNSVAEFTVKSLQSWKWARSSVYYLLGLWSRMVTSLPYFKEGTAHLEDYVPMILQSFISSRFDSLQGEDISEDPLDNTEVLQDQLDFLPHLCRFQYEGCGTYIMTIMDPILQAYSAAGIQDNFNTDKYEILEHQLAWIVHIIAAILRVKQYSGPSVELQQTIDAELSARVFQLINAMDSGVHSQRYSEQSKQRLDLAVLSYFESLKRSYIGDDAMHASKQFYVRLSSLVRLHDHLLVLNVMIQKLASNLRFYVESKEIIDQTLKFFLEMASGYMTAKLLLKLDSIQYIILHHSREHFPFQENYELTCSRTTFYYAISSLMFADDNLSVTFKRFMEPLWQVSVSLEPTPDSLFRNDGIKYALIGLARDLRGIAMAASSRKTYNHLFNWLYPAHMPLLLRAVNQWADTPQVTTPVLKFMSEFVQNKSQRITFDPSSANGILLFREVSKFVVAYGSRILSFPNQSDLYTFKYKGIWLSLTMLSAALSGNYVNFGVFELYGDTAVSDALHVAIRMALTIPFADIMAYSKVTKAYFTFVEIILRDHIKFVLSLNTDTFSYIVKSLELGLQAFDTGVVSQCASSIDHLATCYFNHVVMGEPPASPVAINFAKHVSEGHDVFPRILKMIFEMLLFQDNSSTWSLSKPILSSILMSQEMYAHVKAQILASLPSEQQLRLQQCFEKLMEDISPNLEPKNREKFTQNMVKFKTEFRGK